MIGYILRLLGRQSECLLHIQNSGLAGVFMCVLAVDQDIVIGGILCGIGEYSVG